MLLGCQMFRETLLQKMQWQIDQLRAEEILTVNRKVIKKSYNLNWQL